MKTRVVRRLDLGELRPAIKREDGTVIVDAHLTKCGVFNYLQPDGTIRRELREPEQVFAPESLNSFVGRPVTNDHPPEMVDSKNATQYAIGAVQGDVIRDDDHVRSRLTVYDHDTIQAMQNGKRQVSLGYVCDLDETGGVDPKYGQYDARQINIRGNHCAIVDAARAGGTARVRLDAAERMPEKAKDLPKPRDLQEAAADQPKGQQPSADDKKWVKAGFKAGGRVQKKTHDDSVDTGEADESRRQGRRKKLAGMGMRCDDFNPEQPRSADGKFGSGGANGGGGKSIAAAMGAKATPRSKPSTPAQPTHLLPAQPTHLLEAPKSPETQVKPAAPLSPRANKGAIAGNITSQREALGDYRQRREQAAEQASYKAAHDETFAAHAAAMKAHLTASGYSSLAPASTAKVPQAHVAQAGEHLKSAERLAKPEDQAALEDLRREYRLASSPPSRPNMFDSDNTKKVGTDVAQSKSHAKVDSMAKTGGSADTSGQKDAPDSQEGDPKMGTTDPKDMATRNAAGDDDAKPSDKAKDPSSGPAEEDVRDSKAKQHGEDPDDDDPDTDDVDDPDDDDDESDLDPDDDDDDDGDESDDDDDVENDDSKEDAYDSSYNDDGELTPEARHKMATTSFAVPDREGLPIHDPAHTRAAMSRFNQYDFKTPDEKHAAFNRISQRAKHFGISSDGFEKANKATLDRQDQDRAMIKNEKLRKAREERDAAITRIDALEGQIASLKKDLENKTRTDSAAEIATKVDAKVTLIAEAKSTGAKVDAKMSTIEIKRAVVKHVDGDDIDPKKSEEFVDGVYTGAVKRAKKDSAEVAEGAQALAAARSAIAAPVEHSDADDTDEAAVAARALARSASAHEQRWESPYDRHTTRLDSKRAARLGNRDSE